MTLALLQDGLRPKKRKCRHNWARDLVTNEPLICVTCGQRPKPNKYRAKRAFVDGIGFASKLEAKRYGELKLLERAGEITQLQLQPRFPIEINGKLICTYVGDFLYRTTQGSVLEDTKGHKTPEYKLKKKLVEAIYPGTHIVEIKPYATEKIHPKEQVGT